MADVKYLVGVDASGAITQIQALDKAWDGLNKTGKETAEGAEETEKASESLWASMAIGQIAAQAVMRAFHALNQAFKDSIAEAISQEDADNRLRAALETTGRTVEGNIQVYKEFAAEKMSLTKYTDDEIEASEALLIQMTNLDQKGIKRAIEGAMGLSAVMGTDLQSATMMVTKAMEGNYTALQRVGITVDENLPPQEKQAALLEKLVALYPRAEAELRTFGGAMTVMKRDWSEAMEAFGTGIIKNEDLKKSISDISRLIKEATPEIKEFAEGIGQFIADIAKLGITAIEWINKVREAIGGHKSVLTEEQEAWKKVTEKMGGFSNAVSSINHHILVMGKYGQESREKVATLGDQLWASFNEVQEAATYARLATGYFGKEAQAAFLAAGGEAVKYAVSLIPPKEAINETGDAAAIAATKISKLKGELKAVTFTDVESEIKRIEEGLAGLGDTLTRDSKALLEKRLAELKAQLPKVFQGFSVAEPIHDEAMTIIEDLYGVQLAAMFMGKEVKGSSEEVAAGLAEAGRASKSFDDRMKSIAGPTLKDLEARAKDIRWVLFTMGKDLPVERVKELEEELKALDQQMGRASGFQEWARDAALAMDKVSQVWSEVSSAMSGALNQAQRNREISIENEYKKRLAMINATVKDEAKKQAAIEALEAEFQIKRTAAAAAGAKQTKAVALMDAIVNTADAVTKALTAGPFIGPILAGIIGAMGAVQIALIAKQPIPLARGAVFKKPIEMITSEGQTYKMGEEGVEYLVPEKHLAGLAKGLYGPPRGISGAFSGGSGMVININSPLVQTAGLSAQDLEAAGGHLWGTIEREARRRGRRR